MITTLLLLAAALSFSADTSTTARRDKALEQVNACLKHNGSSRWQCRHLNRNVETLQEVYRAGDKSVLPVLFRFTYLRDFYDDALLADPQGFLQTLSGLPPKQQQEVSLGVAGVLMRLPTRQRFESLRAVLAGIPDTSPLNQVARLCLRDLEANNAMYIVDYFPPNTFAGVAAGLQLSWYSREMYRLGEVPLWPASPGNETVYRFTYIPAFFGSQMVSLTVQQDGSGLIRIKALDVNHAETTRDESTTVPPDRLAGFLNRINEAQFWSMPAESSHRGFDGAEWILEGVQDGQYHIVTRWCPDSYNPSS